MTGNLIPTPIINKNGVKTIVYRKPSVAHGVGRAAIPAPAGPAKEHEVATRKLADLLREEVEMYMDKDYSALIKDLSVYPLDLTNRILKAASDDVDNIGAIKKAVIAGQSPSRVNEAVYFYPMLGKNSTTFALGRKLESLRLHPQLPFSEDYSSEAPEIRSKATALLLVGKTVGDELGMTSAFHNYSTRLVFRDDRLTELVLENHERVTAIIDAMKERKTTDPEIIRSVIDNDSPSLGHGVL